MWAEVENLLATAPSAWRKVFSRYMLPKRLTADDVIASILPFTPSGRLYGPTGSPIYEPPDDVREAALMGLRLSHKHNYASESGIGLARAVQLATADAVSDEAIKRMAAYFQRHISDQQAAGFGDPSRPSRGYMAWLNWGGYPGWRWAKETLG